MKAAHIARGLVAAVVLGIGAPAAFADGDIYSRLFEMKAMDKNKDGMVSKQEFLDMISKAWDMRMQEAQLKGSKMTADQIKDLERILGRTLGAFAGT